MTMSGALSSAKVRQSIFFAVLGLRWGYIMFLQGGEEMGFVANQILLEAIQRMMEKRREKQEEKKNTQKKNAQEKKDGR